MHTTPLNKSLVPPRWRGLNWLLATHSPTRRLLQISVQVTSPSGVEIRRDYQTTWYAVRHARDPQTFLETIERKIINEVVAVLSNNPQPIEGRKNND